MFPLYWWLHIGFCYIHSVNKDITLKHVRINTKGAHAGSKPISNTENKTDTSWYRLKNKIRIFLLKIFDSKSISIEFLLVARNQHLFFKQSRFAWSNKWSLILCLFALFFCLKEKCGCRKYWWYFVLNYCMYNRRLRIAWHRHKAA